MKNCFIVLVGCIAVALFLEFAINEHFGRGLSGGRSGIIATWRNYADPKLAGLEVTISPKQIILDVSDKAGATRIQEEGNWNLHAFYCDSHLDAPAEVVVASELKNEDLELDVRHFIPSHPANIVCVKVSRGSGAYPYPTFIPGQTLSYPPPKGLIRPGMLECDLQMLPWRADRIESTSTVIHVDNMNTLSDGKKNKDYFPSDENNDYDEGEELPMVYEYHSDRPDAPKLLVTVYHGRVTQVVGGAEETADIPYTLPSSHPISDAPPEQIKDRSWVAWLFDSLFQK